MLQLVRRDACEVMDRLLAHVAHGTTDQAVDVMREPVDHYLDQDRWRREVDQVHKRVPMPLALSCELPTPGTFKALDVADVPVLITRSRDGAVHAMINACRHRGSPVASQGTGRANRLTCPYHAWSYDLEGCLKGCTAKNPSATSIAPASACADSGPKNAGSSSSVSRRG